MVGLACTTGSHLKLHIRAYSQGSRSGIGQSEFSAFGGGGQYICGSNTQHMRDVIFVLPLLTWVNKQLLANEYQQSQNKQRLQIRT